MSISICRVAEADLEDVIPLFDAYRQFYEQASDLEGTRAFLQARLSQDDSVLFLARDGADPVGFTQLYPSWSSVRMRRIWILNDLYVAREARRRGVARDLLREALSWGAASDAAYLELATAVNNEAAQALYIAEGWKRDSEFAHFVHRCGMR